MEVIEKTSTKLKLHYKTPRPLLFCLLGSLFISVGTLSIFFFAKKTTLECEKQIASNTNTCEIITTGFISKTEEIIRKQELQRAKIEEKEDRETDRNIILVTKTQEIPLSKEFSYGEEEQIEKVRKINSYLKDPAQTGLTISQDNRFFSVFIGAGFILLGIGTIAIALKQEASEVFYTFDRNAKQLEIKSKKLSNKTAVNQFDFQDIEKAVVRTQNKGYRNDRADLYNLELVVAGTNYPLYTFIGKDMKAIADKVATEINEFLSRS